MMLPTMLRRRVLFRCAALLCAGALPAWAENEATDPAATRIRAFYDALLTVMKQGDKLGIRGRYEKLAPMVRSTFDLPAMTRIAVGPEWNSIDSERQVALIEKFTQMTIATYANRFDAYSGERFEVDAAAEARDSGRIVRTKLIPSTGEAVTLNYLMRGSGERWSVVDIYLTGTISELATRRSEFRAILNSGGPNALIEGLQQQTDKLMRPPAGPQRGTR
jgi:phospholipid transport system substrate-binding protein